MPELSQAEFTRAARGAAVTPGATPDVEPVLMGVNSVARTAVREVHRQNAQAALNYFDQGVAKYAGGPVWNAAQGYRIALNRYIAWDAAVGQPLRPDGLDVKLTVPFGSGDAVRAISHAVVDDGSGGSEARILLWDELRIDQRSAEMIALPILEAADAAYGAGSTTKINVWHLGENQTASITPAAANARRHEVQALIASL